MSEKILQVNNLTVDFKVGGKTANAVRGVSFSIGRKRTLGLVGESGSGKSVTSMAIMRLLECPPAETGGSVILDGVEILDLPVKEMRHMRGNKIAMIFQEPMTSLNPVFTIGDQISEALTIHQPIPPHEAWDRSIGALKEVGIPAAEEVVKRYPHELSGGMKQRAMIAMAIICKPDMLIADEPTTALDVTVQAQILDLLHSLKDNHDMGMLFITHDLGVISEVADDICVIYAGKIVEQAATTDIFNTPRHPYTIALLRSIPKLSGSREILYSIPGSVPSPTAYPPGCKFAPRCEKAQEICHREEPPLEEKAAGHCAACHFA